MNLHEQIRTLGDNALEASRRLASMSTRRKNIALRAIIRRSTAGRKARHRQPTV